MILKRAWCNRKSITAAEKCSSPSLLKICTSCQLFICSAFTYWGFLCFFFCRRAELSDQKLPTHRGTYRMWRNCILNFSHKRSCSFYCLPVWMIFCGVMHGPVFFNLFWISLYLGSKPLPSPSKVYFSSSSTVIFTVFATVLFLSRGGCREQLIRQGEWPWTVVFQSLDAFLCGPWISGYKCSQNWPCAWLRPQGGTPEAIPHQCWRSIEEMSRGNWWDYYEWMTTALVHERGEVISLISTSTFLSLAFPEWLLKWHWKRRQFPNDATKRSSRPHCVLHALLLLAIGNCCLLPVSWGNAKTYPANLWLCTHKVAIISR